MFVRQLFSPNVGLSNVFYLSIVLYVELMENSGIITLLMHSVDLNFYQLLGFAALGLKMLTIWTKIKIRNVKS